LKEKKATGIFRVLNKNGEIVYSLYNNFLKEEHGKVPYVIGFAVDITDRIKAEKEMKVAKKQTEELAQSKQNFLANMSHEIRTPMNAIIGMANQLNKTSLLPQQQFYLSTIQSAAENLLVIIDDILDISKMEAGKLTLEHVGFDLRDVLKKAMQVMMHKAEEKGLAFTNSICDATLFPVLIGDQYRINQILLNLISNAIKFTEKGAIDIQCKVIENANTQQKVEWTVTDSGIGMEDIFAKNLFQKFRQEDESVTRKFGGTGLGMSICKDLVELMGGSIAVESKKGIGTTVSFIIPLEKGALIDLPVKSAEVIDGLLLKGKRILVVDDNEMNRLVASTILDNFGVLIDEAHNGKDAIEKIQNNHFDLILMDVQMPIMDGIEATKIIRETISNDLPIIALTALAVKGDKEKTMRTGMNDYLSKPFEEEKLIAIITKWLGIQSPAETSERIVKEPLQKPLYDLSKLENIAKGNSNFISKMIGLFIAQTPLSMKEMNDAFVRNDFLQISKIAHRMKSSIDNLGIESNGYKRYRKKCS
jgi:signal transduction histidine kinase/CheY-like chemotaxis protein